MGKRVMGELELAILNIIRSRETASVKEVQAALGGNDKYTTVMTVMSRLVDKGELQRERKGLHYSYSMRGSKSSLSLLEKWRQKIFGGKSALMINYLLESDSAMTDDEWAEIEKMIATAKAKRSQ